MACDRGAFLHSAKSERRRARVPEAVLERLTTRLLKGCQVLSPRVSMKTGFPSDQRDISRQA